MMMMMMMMMMMSLTNAPVIEGLPLDCQNVGTGNLAGCWGCVCVPGGCAIEMKQNQGADTLVHKGIAFILFGIPATYEEKWHRQAGTNTFMKAGAGDKLHYNCGSSLTCLGPGIVRHAQQRPCSPSGMRINLESSPLLASRMVRPPLTGADDAPSSVPPLLFRRRAKSPLPYAGRSTV